MDNSFKIKKSKNCRFYFIQMSLFIWMLVMYGNTYAQTQVELGIAYATKVFDGDVKVDLPGSTPFGGNAFRLEHRQSGGVGITAAILHPIQQNTSIVLRVSGFYSFQDQNKDDGLLCDRELFTMPTPGSGESTLNRWLLAINIKQNFLHRKSYVLYAIFGPNTAYNELIYRTSCADNEYSLGYELGLGATLARGLNLELRRDQNIQQFIFGLMIPVI